MFKNQTGAWAEEILVELELTESTEILVADECMGIYFAGNSCLFASSMVPE